MSARRLTFYLSLAVLVLALAGIPMKSQFIDAPQAGGGLIVGRNVNMVSGTQLPYGDPWLQRQNEPSIAVSTRNPLHLLGGANDYRTIDMPEELLGEPLPGQEDKMAQALREPWLGVFKSFDGGQTWITTLLPGFLLDSSSDGTTSQLKGWQAAADPVVRAGTNGMFYYSGIAFNRTTKEGVLFVARFIDNNNRETNTKEADCIKYIDTKIIAISGSGVFIDKPWMTVGLPKNQTNKVTINGQNITSHNVYVVYSEFTGDGATLASKIRFAKSEDCGQSWSQQPIQLSTGNAAYQGATIAVNPLGNGHICVAWRRFAGQGTSNSILFTRSTDWGKSFGAVREIASFYPFDQGSWPTRFRTNSYPTIVIDDKGYIYVAWSQRMGSSTASARIVLSRSDDGVKWSTPTPVDDAGAQGHQIMPSLTFGERKLMLAWYDQREDYSGDVNDPYISDSGHTKRHTLDIRVAEAERGVNPVFQPSVKVSRYRFVLDQETGVLTQAQWNPFNYPLFNKGLWPFMGDYIDISPSPMFVLDKTGKWKYNSDPSSASVYHIAWTDNRDVRPPEIGTWQDYGPPNSLQDSPFGQTNSCNSYLNAGMRNQNVYTSAISKGIIVGSPGNTKPLGDLGTTPDGKSIPRAFVVFVRNTTDGIKSFRLTFASQPKNGRASFLEFEDLFTLDVKIAPYSSISRSVFVDSKDPKASVEVDVAEIDQPDGQLISGGLASYVILNPESENPGLEDPDLLTAEVHNPEIVNPEIVNWDYDVLNPEIVNPEIVNPEIVNPEIVNFDIENPEIVNPEIVNPEIVNPEIVNGSMGNPSAGQFTDVIWKLKNIGNTTSSYIFKTLSTAAREDGTLPGGIYAQLLVYRVYKTPAEYGSLNNQCDLREQQHHELVLNIINPEIVNPEIVNLEIENPEIVNPEIVNATFNVEPEGEALVLLRLWTPSNPTQTFSLKSGKTMSVDDIIHGLIGYASGTSRNTEELKDGVPTYPAAASELIITTKFLSDGRVGQPYSDFLTAAGGTPPYTWSIDYGSLPAGLFLNPTTGQISGTPTTDGNSSFTVRVTDSASATRTQDCWITILGAAGGYTISGRVMVSGSGLSGVTMNGLPGSPVTDSSGYYSSVVTPNWSGTVTPTNPAYTYSPASTAYTSVTTDQVTNYSATIITFTISGTVANGVLGLQGVVMNGLPGSPQTNSDGYYTATVTYGWSGTVTPTRTGYTFAPSSQPYSNVTSNQTTNYQATLITYTLTISKAGTGAGTVTSDTGGINCGPVCSAVYNVGSSVQLTAAWAPGSTFSGWSGDVPTGHENEITLSITMDATKNLTATFTAVPPLVIATVSIPDGVKAAAYDTTLHFAGGLAPVNWSISAGSLPAGLSLDSAGQIAGTPTVSGYSGFTVQALDASSQTVTKAFSMTIADWVARYNGPGNDLDYGQAIAVDSLGNVYVTGDSLGSATDLDCATIKYNSVGDEQWYARYNGPGNFEDVGFAIAVDSLGNVYVTGSSFGIGAYNRDYVTIKYNSVGDEQWYARYNGPGNFEDVGFAIAVDASGNVYVTGDSTGSGTYSDYATIKYNSAGVEQWVARYNGPGSSSDGAKAIAVDSLGNVYVTGFCSAGSGGTVTDYATIKYNSAGVQQWVAIYNGPGNSSDTANAIAVDSLGNVYVTGDSTGSGTYSDYATIKYNSAGVEQWAARYNGAVDGEDGANAIALDPLGDVYITGYSVGSGTGRDYATIKYNSAGAEQWVARYNGAVDGEDGANAIAVNPLGDVYVIGYSTGSPSAWDYATIQYSSTGVLQWAARYNGPGNANDYGKALAVDSLGNVCVTGESVGSGTVGDYSTIRYTQAFPSTLIITTDALDIGYVGTSYAKTLWAFGGSGSRSWSIVTGSLPPGMDLSTPTGRIVGTPNAAGTYNFRVRVQDGSLTDERNLSITILAKIAFHSNRDGNTEIYVMNADGTGQTNLTNNSYADLIYGAPWSPDGSKIAFVSNEFSGPYNFELFVMNSNGSGRTRLTPGLYGGSPRWSPDGSKIMFQAPVGSKGDIFSINPDGSGQTNLSNNAANDGAGEWSPAGGQIVFQSDRDGNDEIYVMNADGTYQTRLTNNSSFDIRPVWSPIGTKIAFVSNRDGNYEIYVMNADGTGQTRLTSNSAFDDLPYWSPDGNKILFNSNRDGSTEIYVMNADGTGQIRLTFSGVYPNVYGWSPDGSRIVFVSSQDGDNEIYVMNADGTGQSKLTNNSADDNNPYWSRK